MEYTQYFKTALRISAPNIPPELFFMNLINFHSSNSHNKNKRKTYSATVSVKSIVNIIIKIGNAINFM